MMAEGKVKAREEATVPRSCRGDRAALEHTRKGHYCYGENAERRGQWAMPSREGVGLAGKSCSSTSPTL